MGSNITDWALVEGPMYMGANSSWEMIWTIVAAVICVVALISGSRHEMEVYKKLKKK